MDTAPVARRRQQLVPRHPLHQDTRAIRAAQIEPRFGPLCLARVVGLFASSGWSWSVLVRELVASPLVTHAAHTKTLDDTGGVVAVSRRDHLCAAWNARLGLDSLPPARSSERDLQSTHPFAMMTGSVLDQLPGRIDSRLGARIFRVAEGKFWIVRPDFQVSIDDLALAAAGDHDCLPFDWRRFDRIVQGRDLVWRRQRENIAGR